MTLFIGIYSYCDAWNGDQIMLKFMTKLRLNFDYNHFGLKLFNFLIKYIHQVNYNKLDCSSRIGELHSKSWWHQVAK